MEGFHHDICHTLSGRRAVSRVLDFKVRQSGVRAMRIILGETTRSQIVDFCPGANVGVKLTSAGHLVDDDIRWLVAPGGDQLTEDGDWLVHQPGRGYEILHDTEFHALYEADDKRTDT